MPVQSQPRPPQPIAGRAGSQADGRTAGRPANAGSAGGATDARSVAAPATTGAAAVLRAVLDHGPVARTLIGQATGLSPAAVSRQTAELISLGLVRELPAPATPPRAGRPFVPLDIDTDRYLAYGVHIGVPTVTFGLLDLRGRVVAQEALEHDGDAASVSRLIGRHLPGFARRHGRGGRALGLGVVSGGRVDNERGVIVEHAPLGWRDVHIRDELAAITSLPVHVDGHARAIARAEILFGPRRARRSLVHLFVGYVVDAAFATDGVVHRGSRSAAGDVAHLPVSGSDRRCACGRTGCFQAAVSETTLLERAVRERVIARPDSSALLAAAVAGEPKALAIYSDRLRIVGRVIALLMNMLDPDDLILTESAVIGVPALRAVLYEEIAAHARACPAPEKVVRPNSFGAGTPAVAAGATVLDAVHSFPRGLFSPNR
ncbi:MAG: ROK family transcriptional regulator [Frankia sp.]